MNPFEFDHVEWLMEREAWEAGLGREERLAKIAYRTAEDVFDRVKDYCKHSDEWFKCVMNHSPDKLDEFIKKYLNGEEVEELKRVIEENSDVYKSPGEFWNEVKLNYYALWAVWVISKLADLLGEDLMYPIYSIEDIPNLSYSCRIKRLEAYARILHNFHHDILRALKEKKPLSKNELYHWFTYLEDLGIEENQDYNNIVNYWLNFYDMLADYEKLELLERLLNKIDDAFSEIRTRIKAIEKRSNLSINRS